MMNQTQKHTTGKKLLALLLALVMILSLLPTSVLATGSDPTVVIAGSDFQNPNGNDAGAQTVTNILTKMQNAGYTKADGFLFCGDYDYSTVNNQTRTEAGITALKNAVTSTYNNTLADDRMVFVQGNHDAAGSTGLAASGDHDAAEYGVFVINEDDYMWRNSNETTIRNTAANLKTYLDTKAAEGFAKPIFVVSHLPLHYSMRTKNDGDGMYANYIFDVLNDAGEKGLNIIFLYGHDHSNGWDDYLGGSCVYLAKGDKINIAQASQTDFKEKKLNFTYMNAGFTGYYENHNGADNTLTMTVFKITGDTVQVERYDANGKHNLKSAGVTNSYKQESGYDPNTTVYRSPQAFTLATVTPPATVSDGNVSVTAPGLTGLKATKKDVTFDTNVYSAYVSYDITPAGYTQGNTATVAITLDAKDGFDSSRKVTVIDKNGTNSDLTVSIVDGKVTFTTNHFSTYDIAQEALAEPTERTYTRVTSTSELESGKQYLLIYNSSPDYFMQPVVKTQNSRTGFTIIQTDVAGANTITGTDYIDYEWTLTKSGSGWLLGKESSYAKLTDTGTDNQKVTATLESSGDTFTIGGTENNYTFSNGVYYLNYNDGGKLINGYASNPAAFYIYKLTTEPAEPTGKTIYLYVGQTRTETIDGESVNVVTSNDPEGIVTASAAGTTTSVSSYVLGEKVTSITSGSMYVIQNNRSSAYLTNEATGDMLVTGSIDHNNIASNAIWTITSSNSNFTIQSLDNNKYLRISKDSATTGDSQTLKLSYKDGTWTIKRSDKYYLNDLGNSGTQAGGYSKNDDGSKWNIYKVTNQTASEASTTVTFTGRAAGTATVTVGSVTYKVIVRDKAQLNDYPEYPNEGSVRVEKTGQGVDFQNTGVAKIELSTTGVPMSKGVDVILMLDTSSSMRDTIEGTTRIDVLRESVANMLTTFNAPDATTGVVPDIRVAIADFNGYEVNNTNSPIYLDSKDHLTGDTIRDGTNSAKVYTGTANYTSGAFVAASTYDTAEKRTALVNSITTASGTNYDAAFYYSYQLGQAITDANNTAGEERDLYVVFMSDGAPFQYNGFSANSDKSAWNNWLQGTKNDAASGSHSYFYNRDSNKNWWAEAIKGDTGSQYTVIDKTKNTAGTNPYMTQVPGLGAKMYSIGFCLAKDNKITVASMENVLQKIATDSSYYIKADSASDLNNAFNQIATNIKKAGYDATFTDEMGEAYDLKITSFTANNKTVNPTITVSTYQLYKKSEVGTTVNGVTVTEAMVGTRKSDMPTVQETVTFNANGTEAYSDKIDSSNTNILTGNKINAKLFTYDFETETFSWNVGDITEDEQVLSYYVYLTGSMEGKRAAGSYPTNKSAVLTYKNWLDHDAQKGTVSPVMPWESANVSYAFYLVDENGTPVVNQTTGETGSFANAVKVTQPVVYSEVLLNSAAEVEANIVAQKALPAGYELYDADAAYTVSVRSGDGTGSWTITRGNSAAATTYVAQYDPNNSAAVSNALLSTEVNGGQNDYTHTVVWFAVKYQISCVPDAVVIDFGLPVDISVLANDILGEGAAVVGLAAVDRIPDAQGTAELAAGFSQNSYTGTYGTATINGTKVRYTPKDMQMNGAEKFAYAAKANLENDQKYYYSTVTVIPAANIYYEDSFVTFDGAWEPVGQTKDGITQQEDRPGQFSLSAYDANNVYGYDAAYTGCTTYSLGSAKKVTVNSETNSNPPTATFTFTGTGFDLISLTSNTTGTIFVEVYPVTNNEVGKILHRWAVDTYYGYTRIENGYIKYTWTLTNGQKHADKEVISELPEGAQVGGTPKYTGDITYEVNYQWTVTNDSVNALYQIPVIRGQGLEYGTYQVIIKPTYYPAFDNVPESSDYDFYLDAVRIYDPAGKNPTGEIGDAYKADGEGWPNVIELRSQLIKEGTLNIDNDNSGSSKGIVFVDGIGNTGSIDNYTNYGPNNEVYLASGQAIAFKLKVDNTSKIASIQLAAKAPQGTAVAKVNDGTSTEITTATEMYYDITHRVTWSSSAETTSNTIVVANTGSNILSLTNIKITYKEAPVSAPEAQVDAQVLEEAPIMLLSMRGITAPVEPEPTFAPERFEAAWNRSTVRAGQKATLTVKTSEDVEAVVVDGVTIDTYRTRTQRTGWGQNATKVTYREFTYTITAAETADYAITAVNAEGIASEPITAALTVQAASQRPSFGGWLDKIFNRWF